MFTVRSKPVFIPAPLRCDALAVYFEAGVPVFKQMVNSSEPFLGAELPKRLDPMMPASPP
jgi:hypothetical protein